MTQDYPSRICVPVLPQTGSHLIPLYTRSGVQVCTGYTRIVIGGRGPYVEITNHEILMGSLMRVEAFHVYYDEYRTQPDAVKVYYQRKPVDYADYRPGLFYISPFDLYTESGQVLIEPLRDVKKKTTE